MAVRHGKRGVSKAQWLEAGLEALVESGVSGMTIEGLARSLGIAKAGFYWHFRNRNDLLHQLLDYWSHEFTKVVADNPEVLALEPKTRLIRAAEMILEYDLTAYELAIRQWALHDPVAARTVRRVNRARLDFVRDAFEELGFKGDDLEMRALVFTVYQSFEGPMFREVSRKRRRELIARRIALLTGA